MNPEQFVRDLNTAWVDGDYEALYTFFDADVVMEVQGSHDTINGVEALVQSYRDFSAAGTLLRFAVLTVAVHTYASVTVCHLDFEVDYELDGSTYRDAGRDVYVLETKLDGGLAIVWRTQHLF